MPPIIAGWKEYADFPGWGLRRVKVKLDIVPSGADQIDDGCQVRHPETTGEERFDEEYAAKLMVDKYTASKDGKTVTAVTDTGVGATTTYLYATGDTVFSVNDVTASQANKIFAALP